MIRAIMEGVVYSLRDCLEIIKEMGIEINEVRASGGGGKSQLWRQMQADVFGTDVYTVTSSEGPALGVALLAGVGTGVYKDIQEACNLYKKHKSKQEASKELYDKYDNYYRLYRSLYTALKQSFRELENINM